MEDQPYLSRIPKKDKDKNINDLLTGAYNIISVQDTPEAKQWLADCDVSTFLHNKFKA